MVAVAGANCLEMYLGCGEQHLLYALVASVHIVVLCSKYMHDRGVWEIRDGALVQVFNLLETHGGFSRLKKKKQPGSGEQRDQHRQHFAMVITRYTGTHTDCTC